MLTINQRFLKLSNKRNDLLEIDRDYQMDEEVKLEITGQISEVKYLSTNSDAVDAVYVAKPLLSSEIEVKE